MISLFIIYILIVIIIIIIVYFGKSLEEVQYYHNKLLDKTVEYNKLNPERYFLQCCILSSVLWYLNNRIENKESSILGYINNTYYENNYFYLPNGITDMYTISGITISGEKCTTGFGYIYKDRLCICFNSTSNLSDACFSIYNDMVELDIGSVHEGYYNKCIESILDILQLIIKFEPKEIVLIGHSMGGAIASIMGIYINYMNVFNGDVLVYTFGSPKYGNKQLKNWVDNNSSLKIYNWINEADPVVYKPSNWKYKRIGKTKVWKIDSGNDNVNHGLRVYKEIIEKSDESCINKRAYRIDEVISRWVLNLVN